MRKLDLYIIRQLVLAIIFITATLSMAIWLMQSLKFFHLIVHKLLSVKIFIKLAMLLLPNLLNILLPFTTLMAVMYTYNRLVSDNELVVMKACGVSHIQLLKPALYSAICVTIFMYALNFYIVPTSLHKLRMQEHGLRQGVSLSSLQERQFLNMRNLTLYIRKILSKDEFQDVMIYSSKPNEKPFTITAKKCIAISGKKNYRLILIDGIRHDDPLSQANPPSFVKFAQYVVDLANEQSSPSNRQLKPYEYPIWRLFSPDKSMGKVSSYPKFIAQAHQKVLGPLNAILFVMLALSVILTSQFTRKKKLLNNLLVVGACLLIQGGGMTFMNLADKIPAMIYAAYGFVAILLTLLMLIICGNFDVQRLVGGRS